jgi:hypothetical protein
MVGRIERPQDRQRLRRTGVAARQNAFADWYQPQKDKLDASGKIYRDPSISASSLGLGG